MTTEQRARTLAGDMPWITANLSPAQYEDFVQQVRACLDATLREAKKEGYRKGVEAALSIVEDFAQPSWSVWIDKHGDKTLSVVIRELLSEEQS